MKKERWSPIEGCDGSYEISDYGRVRSGKNSVRRILKQGTDRYGYKTVVLRINGISKTFRVHRLVANAFVPKKDGREYIDHIDTNKSNNHHKNLRWVTKSENSKNEITRAQSLRRIKPGSKFVFSKLPVYQYSLDRILLMRFDSLSDASRCCGLSRSGIRYATKNSSHRYGGFLWLLQKMD